MFIVISHSTIFANLILLVNKLVFLFLDCLIEELFFEHNIHNLKIFFEISFYL